MFTILTILVAFSQTFYEAKVTTFGCSSTEEVSELLRNRADEKAFQTELVQQVFYGQCVEITKGSMVEGSIGSDSSLLLVDKQIEPPGYMAPIDDFERKATAGEK